MTDSKPHSEPEIFDLYVPRTEEALKLVRKDDYDALFAKLAAAVPFRANWLQAQEQNRRLQEQLATAEDTIRQLAEDRIEVTEKHESLLEQLEALREEARGVAHGVIWLDNNIHNYGGQPWRAYFKSCLRDARRLAALIDSNPARRPSDG